MSTLSVVVIPIIEDAIQRCKREGRRGTSWAFHNMTEIERELFDQWLVENDHPLGQNAGTTEQRFLRFIDSLI